MIHPERDDWARQLTALRQQMAEQAASLDASGEFPRRNIDHLRAGLVVSPCRHPAAARAPVWPSCSRSSPPSPRGEPATALIVCMQYLHHLRLAENDASARAAAPAGFSRCCRTRWPHQQPARRAGAGLPGAGRPAGHRGDPSRGGLGHQRP